MRVDVGGIGLEVADRGSGPAVLLLHGFPDTLPPVTAPVLGVWASGDRFLVEASMAASGEHVAGPWTYVRLDGPGHWMQLDQPEAVNGLLLDFLSRVGTPAPA